MIWEGIQAAKINTAPAFKSAVTSALVSFRKLSFVTTSTISATTATLIGAIHYHLRAQKPFLIQSQFPISRLPLQWKDRDLIVKLKLLFCVLHLHLQKLLIDLLNLKPGTAARRIIFDNRILLYGFEFVTPGFLKLISPAYSLLGPE
ncbi:uncharacterized protein N7483_005496 [Penicillium malachiteum]|uniref:uncharacterized protein n=1 Tax=Penicillium malachiteum TaxID=1324776 RepID=UPI0025478E86|nr:uncharacterized protein N7483_005496 [Penicillium malachiteum]KAJ5730988.1 hypothetical protein N7483_005496 [Penicillium malachiteum]